uniref:PX domain-containing protein n=1 Tax=Phocoena sinus TaxID=42100 RepID=A0A8C9CGG0_PHOSS
MAAEPARPEPVLHNGRDHNSERLAYRKKKKNASPAFLRRASLGECQGHRVPVAACSRLQCGSEPGQAATLKARVAMATVPKLLQQQEEEHNKVKFTVHTKTTLPTFQSPEFSVTRQHEDFVWLHDTLIETTDYAGLIIPPAPKMQKLGEGEGFMTKEEFAKMKQELEAEYLKGCGNLMPSGVCVRSGLAHAASLFHVPMPLQTGYFRAGADYNR